MRRYSQDEEIYVPHRLGKYEACNINTGYPAIGKLMAISNVIVLTEEELLDLMQESIEYSNTTLLRQKAIDLLQAKLK